MLSLSSSMFVPTKQTHFLPLTGFVFQLHKTEATNQVQLDYALEPLDFAAGNPPTSY